ncbi:rhodanese-like domain-containing protein [Massilia sp. W12]|uniref:rhodanese-like domain-containing protein n=1 Tax=Massilia sp. W12 TaxID=3126507 RepID=UPI0030CD5EE0
MKFFLDNLILILLACFSGGALLWQALSSRGPKASPQEATMIINQGKVLILDVRESSEFATGHLRDSRNIPLSELQNRIGELNKAKSKSVVVVCQSGARAAKAVPILLAAGFTNVVRLDGGISAWLAQEMPIVKPAVKEAKA